MGFTKSLFLTAGAAAAATLIAAPAAHADSGNTAYDHHWSPEACKEPGYSTYKFALYYNSNFMGSYRNMGWSVWNFGDERYHGTSAQPLKFCLVGASAPAPGSTLGLKNNAASAENRHPTLVADVYYNSGYKGAMDDIGWARNLNYTKNNNASFRWR